MEKVLFVVANRDFNDDEYLMPKAELERREFEIEVASLEGGMCYGVGSTVVDESLLIREIDISTYRAVVFIGGHGMELYFDKQEVLNLARDFYFSHKLVCAICIAPVLLAKAGILRNKRATVWPGAEKNLLIGEAIYTGQRVTVDSNVITANGPDAAKEFGDIIGQQLQNKID